MMDGHQVVERVTIEREACHVCGYRARISRQTAELPPAGLVGRVLGQNDAGAVVESRARVKEAWVLCLQCLRRERWGWEGEQWKLLQVLDLSFHVPDNMYVHAHELPPAIGRHLEIENGS